MKRTFTVQRSTATLLKVLSTALESPSTPFCGADIVRSRGVLSGTLYPLLDRLEQAGWLESSWECIDPKIVGRPRRKMYLLTALGKKEAVQRLQPLQIARKEARA